MSPPICGVREFYTLHPRLTVFAAVSITFVVFGICRLVEFLIRHRRQPDRIQEACGRVDRAFSQLDALRNGNAPIADIWKKVDELKCQLTIYRDRCEGKLKDDGLIG